MAAVSLDRERLEDILEDRWRTLTLDVMSRDASATTSGLYDRLSGAIRELAGRMVHGVGESGDEYDRLTDVEDALIAHVESEIMTFALRVELARQEQRAPDPRTILAGMVREAVTGAVGPSPA
jgi:hypothetical protein